jgi:hypothetical protein
MNINDLKELQEGKSISVFCENAIVRYDKNYDEFIAETVNDGGDFQILSRNKQLEDAIKDIDDYFNE